MSKIISIWLVRSTEEDFWWVATILPQKNSLEVISQIEESYKVRRNEKDELFNMSFPHTIPLNGLESVHSCIKSLFSAKDVAKIPRTGRLKYFLRTWILPTKDSEILELVEGYKIPFHENPVQESCSTPHMSPAQRLQVKVEINNLLKKGAICKTSHQKEKFLSDVFLLGEKDDRNCSVINLKCLN